MTAAYLRTKSNEEINRIICEKVHGWIKVEGAELWQNKDGNRFAISKDVRYRSNHRYHLPATDDNDIRLVRQRIAELGLQDEMRKHLFKLIESETDKLTEQQKQRYFWFDWAVIDATARQQCLAAIRAMGGE